MKSTLFRTTAMAAGFAVALAGAPTVAAPLAGAAPVAEAVQQASPVVEKAYWRHYGHHYGYGSGALFAGAALGIIGLALAGAYRPGYYGYSSCDPYDPYDACSGPSYYYGGGYYPHWGHRYGFYGGRGFGFHQGFASGGFHNFSGHAFGGPHFASGHNFGGYGMRMR
jgi:hypothetical protein